MKRRRPISFKALLLLLVYAFSNSPSALFHHHETERVAHERAVPCEHQHALAHLDGKCDHQTTLAKATEKCWLCDNHTVSPHSFQTFLTHGFSKALSASYKPVSEKAYFQTPSSSSSRGPPSVSSPV